MEVRHVTIADLSIPVLLADSPITTGQMALLAVVVAAVGLSLLSNARRRREGGPSAKAYAREQIARLKEDRGVHKDVTEVMLALQQLAREVNAQLDNRFTRLEKSIADADERIERLDRMVRRAGGEPTLDAVVGDDEQASHEPIPGGEPIRERVCALHGQGRAAGDIARALGRSVGEVELIIALYGHGRHARNYART